MQRVRPRRLATAPRRESPSAQKGLAEKVSTQLTGVELVELEAEIERFGG